MLAQRHVPCMSSLGEGGFGNSLKDIVLRVGVLDTMSIQEMVRSEAFFGIKSEG
jgi:hypothetical protein